MVGLLSKLGRDESGATSIEYALIAAIISITCITWATTTGTTLISVFENVGQALSNA